MKALLRSPKNAWLFSPFMLAVWAAIPLGAYTLAVYLYVRLGRHYEVTQSMHLLAYLTACILAWGAAAQVFGKRAWWPRANRLILLGVIWAAAFILYIHLPSYLGWGGSPTKSYWHLLADAFWHGRLYLIDPPTVHDLTLYAGNWYVPNPPMPALMILPYTLAVGVDAVSTSAFSAFFGGLNAVLIYLILEQAAKRGWVQLSRGMLIGLTVLFALGTPNLWLAGNGRMWFLSQVLTLTFCELAALLALTRRSPWTPLRPTWAAGKMFDVRGAVVQGSVLQQQACTRGPDLTTGRREFIKSVRFQCSPIF